MHPSLRDRLVILAAILLGPLALVALGLGLAVASVPVATRWMGRGRSPT